MIKISNINILDPLIPSIVGLLIVLTSWLVSILGYSDLTKINSLGEYRSIKWTWFILISLLFIAICLRLAYKNRLLVSHEGFVYLFYAYVLGGTGILLGLFISSSGVVLVSVGAFFAQYGRSLQR